MRYFGSIILLILGSVPAASAATHAQTPLASSTCEEQLSQDQARTWISAYSKRDRRTHTWAAEPKRVLPLLIQILQERVRRAESIPPVPRTEDLEMGIAVGRGEPEFNRQWELQLKSDKSLPHLKTRSLHALGGGTRGLVYDAGDWDDDRFSRYRVVRFLNSATQMQDVPDTLSIAMARRTYLAGKLAKLLGLDVVPEVTPAWVNGKLAVLSAWAPGESVERYYYLHYREYLGSRSFGLTQAFEFLVNNPDAGVRNFYVAEPGEGKFSFSVFDHDLAFAPGVGSYYENAIENGAPFGSELPRQLDRKFLAALKHWTPERLRDEFAGELTRDELEGLLIRREILLRSAE